MANQNWKDRLGAVGSMGSDELLKLFTAAAQSAQPVKTAPKPRPAPKAPRPPKPQPADARPEMPTRPAEPPPAMVVKVTRKRRTAKVQHVLLPKEVVKLRLLASMAERLARPRYYHLAVDSPELPQGMVACENCHQPFTPDTDPDEKSRYCTACRQMLAEYVRRHPPKLNELESEENGWGDVAAEAEEDEEDHSDPRQCAVEGCENLVPEEAPKFQKRCEECLQRKIGIKYSKRRKRHRQGAITIQPVNHLNMAEVRIGQDLPTPDGVRRPKIRRDCLTQEAANRLAANWAYLENKRHLFVFDNLGDGCNSERPCPFVACKHHLYLDVSLETSSIKLNFPDMEVWEMKESCALDVADRLGITLEEVGEIMNLTRERIRQVEVMVLLALKNTVGGHEQQAEIDARFRRLLEELTGKKAKRAERADRQALFIPEPPVAVPQPPSAPPINGDAPKEPPAEPVPWGGVSNPLPRSAPPLPLACLRKHLNLKF